MTKIDIISGFLGAGKTTLIKRLLAEAFQGEKLVLIENEFGEISIDSGFLKESGVQISEMSSGCICCSLVGDFGKALKLSLIHILLLTTGGTIACLPTREGLAPGLNGATLAGMLPHGVREHYQVSIRDILQDVYKRQPPGPCALRECPVPLLPYHSFVNVSERLR